MFGRDAARSARRGPMRIARSFCFITLGLLVPGLEGCGEPLAGSSGPRADVQAAVSNELAANGVVRVFINLKDPETLGTPLEERKNAIASAQARVLSALGAHFIVRRRF